MPIHKKIISGFKKALPIITQVLPLIPGGALVATPLNLLQRVLGGVRDATQRITAAVVERGIPFITPRRQPGPEKILDPKTGKFWDANDIPRLISEIQSGVRSRGNVPSFFRDQVDAALGPTTFKAPPRVATVDVSGGSTSFSRYKRDVLAGVRSIDNVPEDLRNIVTSSLKRMLAASVLAKFGAGAETVPLRFKRQQVTPTLGAPIAPDVFFPLPIQRRISAMPVRTIQPPPTFDGFAPGAQQVALPAIIPAVGQFLVRTGVAGRVARFFSKSVIQLGVLKTVEAIGRWAVSNPGIVSQLSQQQGLNTQQFIELVVNQAITRGVGGGVILSRNDLRGFNRTVRVAKKLGVFTRRAPRRSPVRGLRTHRHTVISRRK